MHRNDRGLLNAPTAPSLLSLQVYHSVPECRPGYGTCFISALHMRMLIVRGLQSDLGHPIYHGTTKTSTLRVRPVEGEREEKE